MGASEQEVLVGGQAVMEGVLMKLPRSWAVTVRRESGELVTRSGTLVPWSERWRIFKVPVVRGVGVLGQMMSLGMRTLWFSSDVLAKDLEAKEAAEKAEKAAKAASRLSSLVTLSTLALATAVSSGPDGTEADEPAAPAPPAKPSTPDGGGMSGWELAFSIGLAVLMFLTLFKALPLGVAWLAGRAWPALGTPLGESVISGVALALVFVGYLWAMSLIPDIRRVFQYHGAEHMVVHVHEARETPSLENARPKPTLHPRCGTSFLFFMVLTSIVVWAFLPMETTFLAKLGMRLAAFPLIVGLSYELIRLSARHRENPFFRLLMAPGLWSQKITTKRPDDGMLLVSLSSLDLAAREGGLAQAANGAWGNAPARA